MCILIHTKYSPNYTLMFIAEIDGKEVELKPDQIKAKDEGYAVVTPDRVPDGYYTESAVNSKIKDRIKTAKINAKDELLEDADFNKRVLSRYNISLGDDGKPKGIKTDSDLEEVKKSVAEQVKKDYESKLTEKDTKLNSLLEKGKKSTIIEAASRFGIDGKYLEPLVEGGSPYLVREVQDSFDWNDEIGDYALKDRDGTFAVDGNGFVTADKFFEKNSERFKGMMKDQRQKGSGFGSGGTGSGSPGGNPAKWDTKTKLSYIAKNGKEGYAKALDAYKAAEKSK